jgi:hypothetical protein
MIEQLAERVIARMDPAERSALILNIVDRIVAQLTALERQAVMERVVDTFLQGLPDDERQATARELVPRLLGELMRSGGMSVDELISAAIESLGALDAPAHGATESRALPE